MANCNKVKMCTFNVKGVHHPIKRKKLLNFLKKDKIQIALLQETHLQDKEHLKLKREWVGQVFFSSYSSNSRGVAILIHRATPFSLLACKKDTEGRFVLIHGTIYGEKITIMNIYAPNAPTPTFWTQVASTLEEFMCPLTFLGGDFNCCISENLDRSPPSAHRKANASSISLANMLGDVNLVDVWRTIYPTARDFTFYSHPHKSYSRIDYFFVPPQVVGLMNMCTIGSIHISDHSPVYIDVRLAEPGVSSQRWRFPSYLLGDKAFIEKINLDMGLFFETNDDGETNPELLWETAKAFLRGSIISYTSSKKKQLSLKQQELEHKLHTAENVHKNNPTKVNLMKAQAIRAALNSLMTDKASRSLFYQKQRLYEFGNKPSKYLARLINQRQTLNTIAAIKDINGKRILDNRGINSVFASFYKTLYTSDKTCTTEKLDEFFSKLNLPTLTDVQQNSLGEAIREEEILEAITLMKGGKSPGPDGFPAEWYKAFKEKLTPYLTKTYNYCFENTHCLPDTMSLANICLILKKDKDPEAPSSFRPISLINVDAKILAKILARRLEPLLQSLVKPDQTGFIKGRNSFNNIRRLLNILQLSSENNLDGIVVSLDSLKAFDRVEWPYLFHTLERFQMGKSFVEWVKLLYASPRASVITNSCSSPPFSLERGTRQGCPISPLLFALAIEPFAELIRISPSIQGFEVKGREHKISLYADDVLLYLRETEASIPALLESLSTFGYISGFKVNLSKTEAMPIGSLVNYPPPIDFPFNWSPKEITYLGIRISPHIEKLVKININPILVKIKTDLDRWCSLPISWLGRISILKMNILPRLLYPLQMLPNSIPNKMFLNIHKIFTRFLWQGKKVRMKISKLQRPKALGGLGVPDIRLYYWAAQLRYIFEWVNVDPENTWIDIESTNCGSLLLKYAPFISHKKGKSMVQDNFIVSNTLDTWNKIKVYFKLKNHFSLLAPIASNPEFPPSNQDAVFRDWHERGLTQLANLFDGGTMFSFQDIKDQYALPNSHFFRYLQVRDFISKNMQNLAPNTTFLERVLAYATHDKFISFVYDTFCSNLRSSTESLRTQWQRDLSIDIDDNMWESILENTSHILTSNTDRETQFKILHRMHWTPLFRSKMGLSSPLCHKCKSDLGTYAHMFWSCPVIQQFWNDVKEEVCMIIGYPLDLSSIHCLLAADVDGADNNNNKLVKILLYVARKVILRLWIYDEAPSVTKWYETVLQILPFEKLTYTLRDNLKGFIKIWQPFLDVADPLMLDMLMLN